jgi:hypothetical protein
MTVLWEFGRIGVDLICNLPTGRKKITEVRLPQVVLVIQSAAISVGCGVGIGLPHRHRESR